ncbi:restriction endonuclease subunit S [Alteromonas lipotrueae]|uniref:restriction endonuclease subunit S n=1 Tax=Alteromonas lipotrueae TaxID=2803814 RepID=UPI001C464793|nr:restriction endonuclease subunit S [Alteromonas lipotrueae]
MIEFGRYSKSVESGIDWLGDIPEHWDTLRLKFIFNIQKRIAGEIGYDVLSITNKGIKLKDIESGEGQLSMDYSKYQLVDIGDFAMNHMDLLTGYVDISEFNGVTSPDYRVFCISDNSKFHSRYYLHLLQLGYKQKLFFHLGQGSAHLGRWRLPTESFNNIVYPVPPIDEQIKIANFLDHETAKIDTLIEKQQQLIKLLKEKRQAVISHAVTKGLNPNAPMKESGVEWLGEVPEHWQVTRAKFVSKIFVPQRNKPDINDSTGTVWITMENMGQKYIYETEKFISPESAKAAGSKVLKARSVIASCVGNFGISSINKVDAIINQQLQAFQPKKIEPEYLQSIVEISKPYFQSIGTAATLIYVNQEGFENLPVLVPPQNEQEYICSFVEGKEAKFRDLVGKSIIQIALLKERRSALISAAVTGKIDVRNWKPTDNKNTEEVEVTA